MESDEAEPLRASRRSEKERAFLQRRVVRLILCRQGGLCRCPKVGDFARRLDSPGGAGGS